jgi:hypothetical protein
MRRTGGEGPRTLDPDLGTTGWADIPDHASRNSLYMSSFIWLSRLLPFISGQGLTRYRTQRQRIRKSLDPDPAISLEEARNLARTDRQTVAGRQAPETAAKPGAVPVPFPVNSTWRAAAQATLLDPQRQHSKIAKRRHAHKGARIQCRAFTYATTMMMASKTFVNQTILQRAIKLHN